MASPASEEQYRREQEAFVSNHGGTTPQEIIYTLLPNVCGVLLTTTILAVFRDYTHRNVRVVIEFVLTVIPSILCCTILSGYVGTVCVVMILISAANISVLGIKGKGTVRKGTNFLGLPMRPVTGKRPFITNFRALTNIITAICILAVDFRIFPRKFAKTEAFGHSLMDTGVGLFIFANALVAPEARDLSSHRQAGFRETLTKNMKNCIQSCLPLLLLGFGRFAIVECIAYQKHVTEYGIHWNFFLTLALVKLFTGMITSTINSEYSLFSGIWILGMHEYIMSTTGLKAWVLSNEPRNDFFSANREGLISIPGYVGLYFISVAVGRLIHSTYRNAEREYTLQHTHKDVSVKLFGFQLDASYNESMTLCIKLSLISAQACIATLFCDMYFNVSRRLANVGYCTWILTLTTILLTLLLLVEIVLDITDYAASESHVESKTERLRRYFRLNLKKCVESKRDGDKECVIRRTLEIFDAINYNGLFFFLLSNLLTGLVNMSMYTLYAQQTVALSILVVYMAVSVSSILILYRLQISFKL
ncbi:GPI-anchored wall transfer protein 1 [Harpegnathos saltator]|uniref:Phosphatidylinositol-glycan biosynthesis class W protein n=2 Tax=Harpegnathos saltator TaxID=610380 RepID=E2BFP0_HARSA|nr:GPI-anchored wall transfer protein 1 [Harpegnathos saltator]